MEVVLLAFPLNELHSIEIDIVLIRARRPIMNVTFCFVPGLFEVSINHLIVN